MLANYRGAVMKNNRYAYRQCRVWARLGCLLIVLMFIFPAAGSDTFGMKEIRVCLEDQYASFGIYNVSPESPDGSRIAYVVYDYYPDPNRLVAPVSLWVCDRDLKNRRMVKRLEDVTCNHNGAGQIWVDNDSIAYSGTHIYKVNGRYLKRSVRVVNVDTGKVEHGPFSGGWVGDSHGGKVLFHIQDHDTNLGKRGLYELNTKTGDVKLLFTPEQFEKYKDQWTGSDDPAGWFFAHAQYSADGTHLSFTVRTRGTQGRQHLFSCRADGSDLIQWGPDKPMHFHWFDEATIWGSDSEVNDGQPDNQFCRRWSRNKTFIETLAGPGCHTAAGPGRKMFAGETWYGTDTIELYIYRRGETKPAATVFSHPFSEITWQGRGHVNPSFSRDGKRIYYNRAVSNELKQPFFCDISNLAGGS